jgi:predicted nucleotidyltransferase
MHHSESFDAIADTLRVSVAALRDREVRFVLGGSLAAWARGGPEPQNDLDLMVRPDDAKTALATLEAAGMRTEQPPEEWLLKAWHGEVMVDLIFQPSGLEMTDEVFDRAEIIPVLAVSTPVMALEDVLTTKLHALDEHSLDYTQLLAISRSLREQIDWAMLRRRTAGLPYAAAFFTLTEELAIAPRDEVAAARSGARVRVVSSDPG